MNETVQEYMNLNWKNVQFLRSKGLRIIRDYMDKAEEVLSRRDEESFR